MREVPMPEADRLTAAAEGIERALSEADVADVRAAWVGDDRPYSTTRFREGPHAGQLLVASFGRCGDPVHDGGTY